MMNEKQTGGQKLYLHVMVKKAKERKVQ